MLEDQSCRSCSQAIPRLRSARRPVALSKARPIRSSVKPRTPKYTSAAKAISPASRATAVTTSGGAGRSWLESRRRAGAWHRSRPGGGFGELRTSAELPQTRSTHRCRAVIAAREFVLSCARRESTRPLNSFVSCGRKSGEPRTRSARAQLAVTAAEVRPALAVPLFLGGLVVGGLGMRALLRRSELVERLAGSATRTPFRRSWPGHPGRPRWSGVRGTRRRRDTLQQPGLLYEARLLAAAEEPRRLPPSSTTRSSSSTRPAPSPACASSAMWSRVPLLTSALPPRIFARASSRSGPASRPGGWLPRLQAGLRRDLGEVAGLGLRPRAPRDTGGAPPPRRQPSRPSARPSGRRHSARCSRRTARRARRQRPAPRQPQAPSPA